MESKNITATTTPRASASHGTQNNTEAAVAALSGVLVSAGYVDIAMLPFLLLHIRLAGTCVRMEYMQPLSQATQ